MKTYDEERLVLINDINCDKLTYIEAINRLRKLIALIPYDEHIYDFQLESLIKEKYCNELDSNRNTIKYKLL
jgi:hypothetical protein